MSRAQGKKHPTRAMNNKMKMMVALTAVLLAVLAPAAMGARVAPLTSATASRGGVQKDVNPIKMVTTPDAMFADAEAATTTATAEADATAAAAAGDGELDAEVRTQQSRGTGKHDTTWGVWGMRANLSSSPPPPDLPNAKMPNKKNINIGDVTSN